MVCQSIRLVEITKEVNTDKGIKRLSLRRTLKIKWRRIWDGTWVGNHEGQGSKREPHGEESH